MQRFDILASSACIVCGSPYGIAKVDDAASAPADTGKCALCSFEDDAGAGTNVEAEVAAEFMASSEDYSWDEQAQAEYDAKRIRNAERTPAVVVEERVCPACGATFEVELHARAGRVKEFCCRACVVRHCVTRWRVAKTQRVATDEQGD